MTEEQRAELLDDEWLIVRHSGEIPEITYHSSLYYLTLDRDGPQLALLDSELSQLKDAAVQRYQEIVLRDLSLDNFHKTIFRGPRRTLYNWQRFQDFTKRQDIAFGDFGHVVARELLRFLEQGVAGAGSTVPQHFINCKEEQLLEFVTELGINQQLLPPHIGQFCICCPDNT
jgi:hypothetical protein